MDIKSYNKQAWNAQVAQNNEWTRAVSTEQVNAARQGQWDVVLTPHKAVPNHWFGELKNKKVLCLASGGGQQAPILAAAGAEVTVFDLSDAQLAQDSMVAKRDNLTLTTIQGDMCDLSCFADECFDLVFHPCSNNFIPDLTPLWQEVARVLKPNGRLLSGFLNPAAYLFDWFEAEKGQTVLRHKLPFSDQNNLTPQEIELLKQQNEPFVFSHSLEAQIRLQLAQGLMMADMYEDDWQSMAFSEYFPPTIATLTIKQTW